MAKNFKRDMRQNFLLVAAVLTLGAVALFFIHTQLERMEEREFAAQRRVGVVTSLKTRFMAIYSGPEVNNVNHGGASVSGLSGVTGSTSFRSTSGMGKVSGNAASYARTAPTSTSASYGGTSGGAVLPTQSSETLHAYGGGGGMGAAGNSSYSSNSGYSGYNSYSSYSGYSGVAAAPALSRRKTSVASGTPLLAVSAEQPASNSTLLAAGPGRVSGPRRIGSFGDYEEGDDYTYNGETHQVGEQKTENGKVYYWSQTGWVYLQDVEEVNEPIGSTLVLLLFAVAYVAIRRKRRSFAIPGLQK